MRDAYLFLHITKEGVVPGSICVAVVDVVVVVVVAALLEDLVVVVPGAVGTMKAGMVAVTKVGGAWVSPAGALVFFLAIARFLQS